MQNSHDRETCARSLRATQESRPSPGAFPPLAPYTGMQQPAALQQQLQLQQQQQQLRGEQLSRCRATTSLVQRDNAVQGRPHRPASLDIGVARRAAPAVGCNRAPVVAGVVAATTSTSSTSPPLSAPAACTSRGFFDDCTVVNSGNANNGNTTPGFELNVNVACSPAGNRGTDTLPSPSLSLSSRSNPSLLPAARLSSRFPVQIADLLAAFKSRIVTCATCERGW